MPKPILDWLRLMTVRNASDLLLTAGFPPAIKLDGRVTPISQQTLTPTDTENLARALIPERLKSEFNAHHEANFAIHDLDVGRFRVSAYRQQGRVGIVIRRINTRIPQLDELNLPSIVKDIALVPRGLVLVVGATGSGKSTTLAAMIGYRNQNCQEHIITVEDPIEFVHTHGKSIISQREIGTDTDSWAVALKNTLRQAPDVIMMGEIRDVEAMEYALSYAETGHLCLSTVHANNTSQTMDRILSFFPRDRRDQVLLDLAMHLKAIVSQRLLPRQDGQGRIPAVEVLLNSPLIADLIKEGRMYEIKDIMARSRDLGMQTFDQSLFDLYKAGLVSAEDALRNADSFNDLRLKIKLHKEGREGPQTSALSHLDII
ncbi:MAG: PilT/PilU family type 4a pilus ATPase [Burkholderiales bacterium]|nr:PilT/PilU family type 4a pilus ATPase [Burkholderiales bacterium]